jgi:hypothetical protein
MRWIAVTVGVASFLALAAPARAQLSDDQLAQRKAAGWTGRIKGSYAKLTTYLGSGTFITREHSDNPYSSLELLLYPRFRLTPKIDLRAYWILECELTQPDTPNGRHCSPADLRLSVHHNRLWTDPWLKGYLFGSFQVWLPTSYESQFNHTVMNLRLGAGYLARLWRERIELSYGFALQKYLPTRRVRGFVAEDGGGGGLPLFTVRASAGQDAAAGSGGSLNDNVLFINSLHAAYYFRPTLSLSIDFLIYNYIRFSVPEQASDPRLAAAGRSDWTWGIIELAWEPRDHLMLGLGISSLQPALTADSKSVRFPFYDFISAWNNYTKWYLVATYVY